MIFSSTSGQARRVLNGEEYWHDKRGPNHYGETGLWLLLVSLKKLSTVNLSAAIVNTC